MRLMKSRALTTKKQHKFIENFSFDSKGLEEAQMYVLHTIVDNRETQNLLIRCYFYNKKSKKPHSVIEFVRYPYAMRGVYSPKGVNELKLMREMQKWQGEGLPMKSEVIADLHGKNFHVSDFKKFRNALETAGVKLMRCFLNFKVVLN